MTPLRLNARTIWISVLAVVLLAGVGAFLISPPRRVERILFFPGAIDAELRGEPRFVPRYPESERQVRALVGELVAGPARIDRSRIVSRATRVQTVIVREDRAFIDLSAGILEGDRAIVLSLPQSLQAIRFNVEYNFRFLDDVVVTIGGEVLDEDLFQ